MARVLLCVWAPLLLGATSAGAQSCPDLQGVMNPQGLSGEPRAMAVYDEDGAGPMKPRLFAAGRFTRAGARIVGNIARWDGLDWYRVGQGVGGPNAEVLALAVFDDGTGAKLYAGGVFTAAGSVQARNIACWNGQAWSAVPGGLPTVPGEAFPVVRAMHVYDADGPGAAPAALHIAVTSERAGTDLLRLYRWNGTAWSSLGQADADDAADMTSFDADGAGPQLPGLYLAANHVTVQPLVHQGELLRWDGQQLETLAQTTRSIDAFAVFDADGVGPQPARLYVAGAFPQISTITARIARFDGTAFSHAGAASSFDDRITRLAVYDPDGTGAAPATLIAGGNFDVLNGTWVHGLAKFDGTTWSRVHPGVGALDGNNLPYHVRQVTALQAYDADGPSPGAPRLFVGHSGSDVVAGSAPHIASWHPTGWAGLHDGPNDSILALQVFNDGEGRKLYAGGRFTSIGGRPFYRIVRWDGSGWSALGGGIGSSNPASAAVYAMEQHNDGSGWGHSLYVGGEFSTAGGPALRIARWNGAAWSPLGAGLGGTVRALASFDADGPGGQPAQLYAGGDFIVAGSTPASRIARWNGSSWSPVGSGVNGPVFALRGFNLGAGPRLFVGGGFSVAGGLASQAVAQWSGSAWTAMPGLKPVESVRCFAQHDDGTGAALYAAGDLVYYPTWVPEEFHDVIVRWGGAGWEYTLDTRVNPAYAMRSFDAGGGAGPALYVAGGPSAVARIAPGTPPVLMTVLTHGVWPDGAFALSTPFDAGGGGGGGSGGETLYVGGSFAGAHAVGLHAEVDRSLRLARLIGCASDGACPGDCTGDGALTLADFACFESAFASGDAAADCDGDGALTVADFGCFQRRFAAGCR